MAVENDNIEIVKLLLENDKLDINLKIQIIKSYKEKDSVKFNIIDKPAIFFAIEKENVEMIKLLLSNDKLNINLTIKINDGMLKGPSEKCTKGTSEKNVLFVAIEKANIEIILLLLANGKLDINLTNTITEKEEIEENKINKIQKRETVLHFAIEKENIEIINLLLSNEKIDINALYEHIEIIELEEKEEIIQEFEKYREMFKTALSISIEKENIEIIKLLLTNDKLNINIPIFIFNVPCLGEAQTTEQTIFNMAVEKGNIEIIELFLSNNNLDINADLIYKIAKIPQSIKTKNEGIDFYNNIDKMIKEKLGKEEYLDVEQTEKRISTLINMIEKENIEIIELLLKNDKLNINELYLTTFFSLKRDGSNITHKKAALHYAIEKGNIDIIKLLVANEKIDINLIDLTFDVSEIEFMEKTPLIIAVKLENIEIIKILLENKKININYHSHFCKPALQIATEKKNDAIINLLSTKES